MDRRLLPLLLLALALPATAQVYRWVDKDGRVHYSQVPPTDAEYQAARPPPKVSDNPNQDALNESLEKSVEDRPKQQADAESAERERQEKQKRCQQAREQLASLGTIPAQRLLKTDEQGNVTRATEDDVAQRRAEFERSARENCS